MVGPLKAGRCELDAHDPPRDGWQRRSTELHPRRSKGCVAKPAFQAGKTSSLQNHWTRVVISRASVAQVLAHFQQKSERIYSGQELLAEGGSWRSIQAGA